MDGEVVVIVVAEDVEVGIVEDDTNTTLITTIMMLVVVVTPSVHQHPFYHHFYLLQHLSPTSPIRFVASKDILLEFAQKEEISPSLPPHQNLSQLSQWQIPPTRCGVLTPVQHDI